jgi:dipeptide transport system ATP-binding protein
VTIQAQLLDLLLTLQQERGMALVLITHDMGVVAETVRQVVVMYAGQVVEQREVAALFETPRHPYTEALLNALPERHAGHSRLPTIAGVVPGMYDRPSGYLFNPRCRFADARCQRESPHLRQVADSIVRCHYPLGTAESTA